MRRTAGHRSSGYAPADRSGDRPESAPDHRPDPDGLSRQLDFRPPLAWWSLLDYLRTRAIPGVESVDATGYRRTVAIGEARGWVAVSLNGQGSSLCVRMAHSLAPVADTVIGRVQHLFDLAAVPDAVTALLTQDPLLTRIVAHLPGLRVAGAFEGFELGVRAVLGQQISVKAATTLAGRWVQNFGAEIDTPIPGLNRLAPTAERMAEVPAGELAATGLIQSRARCIAALAGAVTQGHVVLSPTANVEEQLDRLQGLPGIGSWTAQYIAMRALHWPDAFPGTDLMLLRAAGMERKALQARAEHWRPWRAYATHYLWQSLGVFPCTSP